MIYTQAYFYQHSLEKSLGRFQQYIPELFLEISDPENIGLIYHKHFQMKANLTFYWLIKLVFKFDSEELEKLCYQKIIP